MLRSPAGDHIDVLLEVLRLRNHRNRPTGQISTGTGAGEEAAACENHTCNSFLSVASGVQNSSPLCRSSQHPLLMAPDAPAWRRDRDQMWFPRTSYPVSSKSLDRHRTEGNGEAGFPRKLSSLGPVPGTGRFPHLPDGQNTCRALATAARSSASVPIMQIPAGVLLFFFCMARARFPDRKPLKGSKELNLFVATHTFQKGRPKVSKSSISEQLPVSWTVGPIPHHGTGCTGIIGLAQLLLFSPSAHWAGNFHLF